MGQGPSSVEQWLKGLYILDLQDWTKVAQCHDHLFSMNKLHGPNQSIVIVTQLYRDSFSTSTKK